VGYSVPPPSSQMWQTSFTWFRTDHLLRFEVLMAVSMKMVAFRLVASCRLLDVYHCFRDGCCLHHQGKQVPLKHQ
jgi:hypothetical protein